MLTLATYNFKGGVGKTATAVSVAHLAARSGRRVLLWDLDPQGAATFTFRIKQKVKGGTDKLFGKRGLFAAVRASDFEDLDVLASDLSYRHLDVLLQEGRDDALAERLAPLAEHYDLVVLDCAPTLSAVTENVFTAADVILAPTIPTALSLRTLARFLKHLKTRASARPRVLPFFCMVDRRKSLHVRVCDWAHGEDLGFLRTEIPYSSAVEQISVRRAPLGVFARSDRAARAYESLWAEVCERLDEGRRTPSRKGLDALYEQALDRPRFASRMPAVGASRAASHDDVVRPQETPLMSEAREIEFKLRLEGPAALEAVALAAERRGASRSAPVEQENHFFDTPDAALRSEGVVVRLRREDGRFVLAVKGARLASGDARLHVRAEHEAAIPERHGNTILDGAVLDLAYLRDALGEVGPELVERLRGIARVETLGHVGSFRNRRLRVGPLRTASEASEAKGGADSPQLTLELDRTELPGGRVDHEVELEVAEHHRGAGERLLEELLSEAAVRGEPATSKAKRFFEALHAQQG